MAVDGDRRRCETEMSWNCLRLLSTTTGWSTVLVRAGHQGVETPDLYSDLAPLSGRSSNFLISPEPMVRELLDHASLASVLRGAAR
jgi:hypothetical protein